jgi:hypothetical protein
MTKNNNYCQWKNGFGCPTVGDGEFSVANN